MKAYQRLLKKAESFLPHTPTIIQPRRSNTGIFLLAGGFVAGIVAGAALGLLFAPSKGTETRRAIGSSAKDFGNTVAEKARLGADRIATLKDQAVDTVKSKLGKNSTAETVPVV
ncbi:MAG TPA: YtxH domain-containing protein [Sphingobacteriaceae bacterium]